MTDRDVLDRLEDLRHSLYGATIEAAIAEIERLRFDYSTSRQMIDNLIRENTRLRESPWVSVAEYMSGDHALDTFFWANRLPNGNVIAHRGYYDEDSECFINEAGARMKEPQWLMPIPSLDQEEV